MTDQTHPSYPNPTIQEALCEIRFPVSALPFASQFGLIWDRLRVRFPHLETFVDVLPPAAPNLAISGPVPTQQRFIMRHASRQFLLQFVPGAFTLNTLTPYLGWATMREDIAATWQTVQEILVPQQAAQAVGSSPVGAPRRVGALLVACATIFRLTTEPARTDDEQDQERKERCRDSGR